jgi:hypothetical protein
MNLLEKIDEIASLPENWNGNGALPFTAEVLTRARSVARVLTVCGFECFPTGRDSIQFEKTRNSDYLEIEVFADRVEAYNEIERHVVAGASAQVTPPNTQSE